MHNFYPALKLETERNLEIDFLVFFYDNTLHTITNNYSSVILLVNEKLYKVTYRHEFKEKYLLMF